MADPTKHLSINGVGGGGVGKVLTDIKSLFTLFKTRTTVAFAYGFMFAFVAFTVFLAFNPSSNSSSSLSFSNVFSSSSVTSSSSSSSSSGSYRSQFSSVFSYFFPSNTSSSSPSSSPKQPQNLFNATRSNNSSSHSPIEVQQHPSAENHTQALDSSDKSQLLRANHTPIVNKVPSFVNNNTESLEISNKDQSLKPNQTATVPTPEALVAAANQSTAVKENTGKSVISNYNASLSSEQSDGKKKSNGSSSGVLVKQQQGFESVMESLLNCDLFDGEWVHDDSYPLYKPGSCSLIDEQFNCVRNGRPDGAYQQMKWKPKGCTLPRLNGSHMLQLLSGRRLVFVGDSLNRNMWESLICILRSSAKDPSKVYEAHGRHYFRGEASYSFIFKDYSFSVEFFVSPFLVQEWELPDKNGTKKETLRLDLVGRSSDQYKSADILIFNTGHWWTHEKTSKGKDYYQEGSHVYNELNVLEAFRRALTTWARWVDANVNSEKSMVFFRGYSVTHFSGGQWNSGGACDSETEPIKNETYLARYPPKMVVLEKVLRGMKTHVTYLNITRLTDFRKDAHPSIYRRYWKNLSAEERKSPLRFQDCSHWCLPGVPDAWNELFYAELLIKQNKMLKHQNQKRV